MKAFGYKNRPAPTLTNASGRGGSGGSGAREGIKKALSRGDYILKKDTPNLNQAISPDIQEAGVLQSYPADFRWCGTKTDQFLQCGNAVPPLVAKNVLQHLGGAMNLTVLDLFAGTGVGVACQQLGIKEYGVEIMPAAIQTREANGMQTIFYDVWDGLKNPTLVPKYDTLWASPPCQTFSLAGRGSGRDALNNVLEIINTGEYVNYDRMREHAISLGDERTALVLTPLTYIERDRPMFVVLEQVPPVLPVWERYAEEMKGWGYSAWTGYIHAEQYGVPQTRKRAYLIARRDGVEANPPKPTHSKYYQNKPEKFDSNVLPWVSMYEALAQ